MKQNVMLTIASLLSILLLTLHITDDIVRGYRRPSPQNIALAVLVVLLYGTLVLAERDRGTSSCCRRVVSQQACPSIHMRGHITARSAKSTGGFFLRLTLWALGGLGGSPSPLGARTVESATGQATVVQQPEHGKARLEALCRLRRMTARLYRRRVFTKSVKSGAVLCARSIEPFEGCPRRLRWMPD